MLLPTAGAYSPPVPCCPERCWEEGHEACPLGHPTWTPLTLSSLPGVEAEIPWWPPYGQKALPLLADLGADSSLAHPVWLPVSWPTCTCSPCSGSPWNWRLLGCVRDGLQLSRDGGTRLLAPTFVSAEAGSLLPSAGPHLLPGGLRGLPGQAVHFLSFKKAIPPWPWE